MKENTQVTKQDSGLPSRPLIGSTARESDETQFLNKRVYVEDFGDGTIITVSQNNVQIALDSGEFLFVNKNDLETA